MAMCNCMNPRDMGWLDSMMDGGCGNCGKMIPFANPTDKTKIIEERFCEEYAKIDGAKPSDVKLELERKNKTFLRMLEVFAAFIMVLFLDTGIYFYYTLETSRTLILYPLVFFIPILGLLLRNLIEDISRFKEKHSLVNGQVFRSYLGF